MNTTITRNRWTNKEVKLAKETLKATQGNQRKAAIILSSQLNRSEASIQVRLCFLAKKHPSLRKANIARKLKANKQTTAVKPVAKVVTVKSITMKGNTMIITF